MYSCINSKISKREKRTESPIYYTTNHEAIITHYESISYWSAQVGKLRKEYQNGGSAAKYAKAVNVLCDFLSLAKQYDIALVLLGTILQALHSDKKNECQVSGTAYMTIVLLLKASICALNAGRVKLSMEYSTYPLLFLAENSNQILHDTSIDWDYVKQLCNELINKQENR